MKKDAGLANWFWTLRFRPKAIRLPSVTIYWYEEANLIFFEPAKEPVRLPVQSARPVVPLDLLEIQNAVEMAEPKEAYAFFRDLGNRLLAICEHLVCPLCGRVGEYRNVGHKRRLVCEKCKVTWLPRAAQAEQADAPPAKNAEALPKSKLH